jgi:LysM repeat protein
MNRWLSLGLLVILITFSGAPHPAFAGGCGERYVVKRGDTLRRIAARCGTTVADLVRANGIRNPNLIHAGQVLVIPNRGGPVPVPRPVIRFFSVNVEPIPSGKRVTFRWETTGAVRAMVWSGARQRFPQTWEVAPNGVLTVELPETYYRNPMMTLAAFDEAGNSVYQSVETAWPCRYDYFFGSAPAACPRDQATYTPAAEQAFEHGRMIWLREIRGQEFRYSNVIFVLHDDGQMQRFDDTWTPSEPDHDPALAAPTGRYQPQRGFGKVWRNHLSVRERLGWALGPEQGFDGAWQTQISEGYAGVAYLRTLRNETVTLWGWDMSYPGSWSLLQ